MTAKILQSDIDLVAQRLRENQAPADVVALLVLRGIEPARAAQLVEDLRSGKSVEPECVPALEEAAAPPPPVRPVPKERPRRQRPSGPPPRPGSTAARWVLIIAIIALLGGLGTAVFLKYQKKWRESATESEPAPAKPDTPQPSGPGTVSNRVSLDIDGAGLRIAGRTLRRSNTLENLVLALGTPSRTNQLDAGGSVVYGYDEHGLLLYGHSHDSVEYMVVDFTALAGTNGAKSAFSGALKVAGRKISADSTAAKVAAIPELGLRRAAPDTGVLRATYSGLGLFFMYLKDSQHLSMLQINLP